MDVGVILICFTILIIAMNVYFNYVDKKIYAGVLSDIEDSEYHYKSISRNLDPHHISYRHHRHYVV